MTRIVNVHSMVDVITNSSTEIYIFMKGNAVETAYEILNEILKIADSDKKAEDLFDISIEPMDWEYISDVYWDDLCDDRIPSGIATEEEKKLLEENTGEYSYGREAIVPFLKNHPEIAKEYTEDIEDGWGGFNRAAETKLLIKSKNEDKNTLDIFDKFMSLFNIEASRNG